MNPHMQRIAHTIAALVAGALVILPDLLPLLASYPRAARIVGAVLLVLTNATKIPGFAALLAKYGAPPAPEKLPKPAPNVPVVGLLALVLGSLLLVSPARADFNLDDVAPKVTKCWGNTCLMPAASVNAVLFDLNTRQWQAGTTSLGAGLALLFWADTPWASGFTAHLTGVLSQQGPSFAMPTAGITVARYFEVGYSYRFSEYRNTSYISLAGVVPFDLFTRLTIPERARAARAAMGAR